MSNYPDDIHQYDNDPRSPFYNDGPECPECGWYMECEVDCDEGGFYNIKSCVNPDCPECSDYVEEKPAQTTLDDIIGVDNLPYSLTIRGA